MAQRRLKLGRGQRFAENVMVDDSLPTAPKMRTPDWTPVEDKPAWADILIDETLDIHFQPIVSLKKKAIVGVEALARPQGGRNGRGVTPLELFAWAARNGKTVDLDRLCRRKALSAFSPISDTPQHPLLFLNFESSILDMGVLGSGVLSKAVRDAGFSPTDIVIEINESKVIDVSALQRFVETHREQGFLFALDDLGAGFSNLARIGPLKPEILKLDRALIEGIDTDFHKQEVFRSLADLGRRVGALVLAEGVETEAEVSTCVDLGADMVQGYYFGRPASPESLSLEFVDAHLSEAAESQRRRGSQRLRQQRVQAELRLALIERLLSEMYGKAYADFSAVMETLAQRSVDIECLYVLDAQGMQATPTVTAPSRDSKPWTRLFYPAVKGADHTSKDYFYALVEGGPKLYTTEVYLSLATGRLCRTLSSRFRDAQGTVFILCLDIDVA